MKSIHKGELAELEVQKRSVELGYTVSKPTIPARYDLIIDDGVKLQRAQIKYCDATDLRRPTGHVKLGLVKTHKNTKLRYTSDEIDVVLAYLPSVDKIIKLEADMFHNKQVVYIRTEKPKNNQKKFNWYEDFIW